MTRPKRTFWRWFYRRRARRLEILIEMLGLDFAADYGIARGWIMRFDGTRMWMSNSKWDRR